MSASVTGVYDDAQEAPHMGRIRLLDPTTINQISAGEVVERPASAVKELVENSLDAGATRIEVELGDAGRALIRVRDNGIGMNRDEALAAMQRHATSKIRSVEDLTHVATLGFRGEALPSIGSVSKMTVRTATMDGTRTVIAIHGGQIEEREPEPGPKGTEIAVEDLFFNTPARLKFLKSDTTEVGQILDHLQRYALAYPHVAFEVIHNGQSALRTLGGGSLLEALGEVWSRDLARVLVPIDATVAGARIVGFVSPPHVTKPNRAFQYLFVNGRPVRSRTLTVALDQAFRDLTPERRFAAVCLMIEIEPDRVDVNVSPTKSEVKFQHEGTLFEALRISIRQGLMTHGMMPSAASIAIANQALSATIPASPSFGGWASVLDASFEAQRPLEPTLPNWSPESDREQPFLVPPSVAGVELPSLNINASMPYLSLLDDLRIIGQAMNTFIVAETKHGLVLVDQHVAHERILYEYLCGLKGPSAIEKQPLLVPQTLHLDRRSALLMHEKLDELHAIGYDLDAFGTESFVVRAVPAAIRGKDPLKLLKDVVDELVEASVTRKLVPTREAIWIMSSCKMAVKAGDPLSHAEMEKLLLDLATTENPYHCPHGRPITVTLSTDDLLRIFKRIH